MAESYFNKINKNKNNKTESAGIIRGPSLNEKQVKIAKEFSINLKGKPRGLSVDLIKKKNLIIIVADDVPKSLFDRKEYINFKTTKIIRWKIPDDPGATSTTKIRKIIKLIIKKVKQLNKELEKENENRKH